MSDPAALRSVFEDPTDLEMNDLASPIHPQIEMVDSITPVYLMQAVPHHAFPLILSLLLCTHCGFSKLSAPASNNMHCSHYLLTPLFLHVYNPKDHITWERTSWKLEGTCFIRVEDRMTTLLDHPAERTTQELIFNWSWPEICDRS